jgi:hypothetical protein
VVYSIVLGIRVAHSGWPGEGNRLLTARQDVTSRKTLICKSTAERTVSITRILFKVQ